MLKLVFKVAKRTSFTMENYSVTLNGIIAIKQYSTLYLSKKSIVFLSRTFIGITLVQIAHRIL